MGGWNTVEEYFSDPAGYAAHRRMPRGGGPLDGGDAGGRVTGVGTLPPYIRKLEAVAGAAQAVRVLLTDVLYLTHPAIVALTDALDALDGARSDAGD